MTRLTEDRRRALEEYLYDWLAGESLPGASVAIVHDDELAYATGAGARDLATDAPATPETLYGVGSVTKSVTALAVGQLVDAGALSFDDRVTDHLDDVDDAFDATLHDLLSHASGLPSLGVSEALIARQTGVGEYGVPLSDEGDFYHHLNGGLEERLPDDAFRYSNSGYTLLGAVVAAVDGRPFETYVDEEILEPLGMTRSTFDADEYAADANAATPYFLDGGDSSDGNACGGNTEGRTTNHRNLIDPHSRERTARAVPLPVRELSYAAGGLATSVTELARYLRFHARGTLEGQRLVADETLERMHAGHTETPQGPYGYGWRRRSFLDRTLVGHGGSIAVSTAYVGVTADGEWGVALAANAGPGHGLAGPAQAMLAAAMGRDPTDVPFVERRRALSDYEGRYESYRGIKRAKVSRDGATLRLAFVDALEGSETPLIPVDPTEGRFEQPLSGGDRRPVTFESGDDGVECHVDRWRLHRVGPLGE